MKEAINTEKAARAVVHALGLRDHDVIVESMGLIRRYPCAYQFHNGTKVAAMWRGIEIPEKRNNWKAYRNFYCVSRRKYSPDYVKCETTADVIAAVRALIGANGNFREAEIDLKQEPMRA